jgi:outer membrane lipoprotein-sorting protein
MKTAILIIVLCFQFIHSVTTSQVLARYTENIRKIKTIRAILHIEVKRGETYSYTKVEYINKGDKMYMKAPSPMFFILVSDGQKAQFYSRRDKTVYLYKPGQYSEVYDDPIKEKKDLLKEVSDLKKVGKKYLGWKKLDVYEGRPISGNQFVSKFRLWIDDQTGLLYRMESYDLHGELISRMDMKKYRQFNGVWLNLKTQNWAMTDTEIIESSSEFKDIEVNGEIEDSFFDFKIPEGAKIKDLTKMIMKKDEKK